MDNWLAKIGFCSSKNRFEQTILPVQAFVCVYLFIHLFIFFQKMVYLQYPFTKLSPHKVPQIPVN